MEVDEVELNDFEATMFRGLAARLNFLARDCPNLQFPAKEVCRDMWVPTVASWKRLKRLARYLVTRKAVVFRYEWQDDGTLMTLFTDSDWASCRRTRKSTSGGVVLIGTHCVKTWSCTQGPEYCSMVEGTIKAKGLQTCRARCSLTELDQVVCFKKRHETRSDSRDVVAGGSAVSETCGEQVARGAQPSGSLDEVLGPPDHLGSLEGCEHFRSVILTSFEIASGRVLTPRAREGVRHAASKMEKPHLL